MSDVRCVLTMIQSGSRLLGLVTNSAVDRGLNEQQ